MSNKLYDFIKWVSVIVVPALVLLINTLGKIWGFGFTVEVSATVSAVGVFLGALIQVSSAKYSKEQEDERNKTDKIPDDK